MRNYNLTPEALEDLDNIQQYISADNPVAAENLIEECFSVFDILSKTPLMGHRREDLTPRNVRFWNIHSYLIIYDATTDPISIIRVLSGYRDISSIL